MQHRRTVLAAAGSAALTAALPSYVRAQSSYPTRVIKIIVANPPGGTDDLLSRWVADGVSKILGQSVIIENRSGASTTIGGAAAAAAAADGYTMLCLISAAINQTVLRDNLRYNMQSYAPIIGIGAYPMALAASAAPDVNIRSMDDLLARARSSDGVTFATGGVGSMGHLTTAAFLSEIQGTGLHVTYRNNPECLQALIGGFAHMHFTSVSEAAALYSEPRLSILGVTSVQRARSLPDVPTMTELGFPSIKNALWHGFVAPKGVPPNVIEILADAISTVVQSADFRERVEPLDFVTEITRGDALAAYLHEAAETSRKIIVEHNIQVS